MNKFYRWSGLMVFVLWILAGPGFCAVRGDGSLVSSKFMGIKDGVRVYKTVYKSDGLKVRGLMFLPASENKLPCVIFNHDGISGVSKSHRLSSIRLAKAGYAVFSPSYRGEDGSEGEIEIAKGEVNDVLNAVRMVRSFRQVDSGRIALAGASHGALISMLAASRNDGIKAVVAAYGVMDIYKWWDYLKKNKMVGKDKYTRQTYGDGPQDRPASFAIRNAVSYVKNIKCPVLILQGKKDKIVPFEQALFAGEALEKAKVKHQVVLYDDCLHGFLVYVPFLKDDVEEAERLQTEEAWKLMIEFLNENLQVKSVK